MISIVIAVIAGVMLGVFACKDTPAVVSDVDVETLAAEVLDAALPGGEDNAEIAGDLLFFAEKANIETTDAVAILLTFKENAEDLGAAFTALHTNEYDETAKRQTEKALSYVAAAVSADVAGDLFYAVMNERESSLPYTLSDCRKVATLYFTFYREAEGYSVADILSGDFSQFSEGEINTLLRSLAASLRAVKGLSSECKAYFLEKALLADDTGIPVSVGSVDVALLKEYINKALTSLFEGYESFLSFGAAFAANASAEIFLGASYDKQETTIYYGYDYDDWTMTEISKEEYEAYLTDHQGYDTAFAVEKMMNGYYDAEGIFRVLSDKDVELADRAAYLRTLYQAYAAITDTEKSEFAQNIQAFLELCGEDGAASEYSFDDVAAALSHLVGFNAKDGITEAERTAATQAIDAFDGYVYAYLPHLS